MDEVELDSLEGRLEGSPKYDSLCGEPFSCRNWKNFKKIRRSTSVFLLHIFCHYATLAEALLASRLCYVPIWVVSQRTLELQGFEICLFRNNSFLIQLCKGATRLLALDFNPITCHTKTACVSLCRLRELWSFPVSCERSEWMVVLFLQECCLPQRMRWPFVCDEYSKNQCSTMLFFSAPVCII